MLKAIYIKWSIKPETILYPGQNEYEINFININSGGRESLDVISPWRTMGLNLPGECGPIDTLDMKDAFIL